MALVQDYMSRHDGLGSGRPKGGSRLALMQAQFQQRQLQEKEQKMLAMLEDQQQRTLQRMSQRSSAPSSLNSSLGGGKVRQMFEEMRAHRATGGTPKSSPVGWDKSYPLDPIQRTMSSKSDPTGHRTSQGSKQRGVSLERSTGGAQRSNMRRSRSHLTMDMDDLNMSIGPAPSTFSRNASVGVPMGKPTVPKPNVILSRKMPQQQTNNRIAHNGADDSYYEDDGYNPLLDDPSDSYGVYHEEEEEVQQEMGDAGQWRRTSGGGMVRSAPHGRRTPSTPMPTKLKGQPQEDVKIQRGLPDKSRNTPIPNGKPADHPAPKSPSKTKPPAPPKGAARGSTQSGQPKVPGVVAAAQAAVNEKLAACKFCNRTFAEDRLPTHQTICQKTKAKKTKVFDSTKMRVMGTEAAAFVKAAPKKGAAAPGKAGQLKPGAPPPPKKSEVSRQQAGLQSNGKDMPPNNWRKKHEDFVNTIRYAKQAQAHVAAGGKESDLPPPPAADYSDYIQCPHCKRKFNQQAAERHIPKCKNIVSNKR